jgi:outer membrane protein OmpA-like peptidoglycan-associated protein
MSLAGIFTRDITGTGPGTLVTESCTNPATYPKRESHIVQWNVAGTKLFVGQSEYVSATQVEQKIVLIDPSVSNTSVALIGTETTESFNNFTTFPNTLVMSPDGTKLALITLNRPSLTYKLWTLNADGTALVASSVVPTIGSMSWARPITLDVAPTTTSTTIAPTTTVETTTTVAATTTLAPTTTTTSTVPESVYASAVPGITVTDPTVYQTAPKQVAGESAIMVLTPAQNKIADVVSKTPSICLPSDNDLVFIDEGRCIAEVVNTKTRKVLRTLKTTVVADDISELEVGNEIAILTPLYFVAGTFDLKAQSLSRLTKLKDRVTSAGSVLVAGHSGVLMGNTPENIKLAKARADATVAILKARGAKGPFSVASVGALDPVTMVKTQAAQEKNRRVVIVLIP